MDGWLLMGREDHIKEKANTGVISMGERRHILNNTGDKAALRSNSGTLSDICSRGEDIGYKSC
jgi:hypothetical protein